MSRGTRTSGAQGMSRRAATEFPHSHSHPLNLIFFPRPRIIGFVAEFWMPNNQSIIDGNAAALSFPCHAMLFHTAFEDTSFHGRRGAMWGWKGQP